MDKFDASIFFDFYYCLKILKSYGLKIDFNNFDRFIISRREDDKLVSEAYSLEELSGFCSCLRSLGLITNDKNQQNNS